MPHSSILRQIANRLVKILDVEKEKLDCLELCSTPGALPFFIWQWQREVEHLLFIDREELLAPSGLPLSKRAEVPLCLWFDQLSALTSGILGLTNVLPST